MERSTAIFVDGMGAAAATSGVLSQLQGRIFALLYLHAGALALEDIAAELEQSKSNISVNIRGLVEWHLVRRTRTAGVDRGAITATLAAVRLDFTSVAWTWGTTAAERARSFPCDPWLPGADDALFRAVDVDAPAAVAFRWVCQLRVAPYSYDWIDNFGRGSPRAVTRGLDAPAVGRRAMSFVGIVGLARYRH